jgi:hypothetical protein
MSLRLDMQVEGNDANTLDGLVVRLTLQNLSDQTVDIPTARDESGAWKIRLLAPNGDVLRLMSGRTNRIMTTGDAEGLPPFVGQLAPGASWTKEIDLATYHYLLSEGQYQLQGKFDWQSENIHVESQPQPIQVTAAPVSSCQVLQENPFIPLMTVLLGEKDNDAGGFHLRANTLTCPLAAWYANAISLPLAAEDVTLAQMTSVGPSPFARLLHRALVWRQGDSLVGQIYEKGRALADKTVTAPLPAGHRFLPVAAFTAQDEIMVFTLKNQSVLHCSVMRQGTLERRFLFDLPGKLSFDPAIGVDHKSVQIMAARGGTLFYINIDFRGRLLSLRQVYQSKIPHVLSCSYARSQGVFRVIFVDAPGGKNLEFVEYSVRDSSIDRWRCGPLPLRGDLREVNFSRSRDGDFYAVVSTSRKRLYAIHAKHPPYRIAEGEVDFFPHLVSFGKTYVGYYSKRDGYRFVEYRIAGRRPKLISS